MAVRFVSEGQDLLVNQTQLHLLFTQWLHHVTDVSEPNMGSHSSTLTSFTFFVRDNFKLKDKYLLFSTHQHKCGLPNCFNYSLQELSKTWADCHSFHCNTITNLSKFHIHTYFHGVIHVFYEWKSSTQSDFSFDADAKYLCQHHCIHIINTGQYITNKHLCIRFNVKQLNVTF